MANGLEEAPAIGPTGLVPKGGRTHTNEVGVVRKGGSLCLTQAEGVSGLTEDT